MTQALTEPKSSPSPSSVEIVAIPPDGVSDAWPILEPLLAKATDRSKRLDTDDIFLRAETGHTQLWLMWDTEKLEGLAAAATALHTYQNGYEVVRGYCCGGTQMERWSDLLEDRIYEYAKAEGVDAIEMIGRRGWGRVWPHYEEIDRTISREIH